MSAMNTLKQPCILYDATFEHHDLEKVKLTFTTTGRNAATRSKYVPIFRGKEGIESLLYTEDRFRNALTSLRVTDGADIFDLWAECVQDSAELAWENIANRNLNNRTLALFNTCIEEYYTHYVDGNARDTMLTYLRSLRRPVKADPRQFVDRMETLLRYTFRLPGNATALNDNEKKQIIFDAFPET